MLTEAIRDIAAKALGDKRVDVLIGFTRGATPFTTRPALIEDTSAVRKLIWNDFCAINLAKYLLKQNKRTGIIANGCTSRNIVTYIIENQIERESVYVIGVPCPGMLDRHKIKGLLGDKKVKSIISESNRVILSGNGFNGEYPRQTLMRQNCLYCRHRNPGLYDILVGEPLGKNQDLIAQDVETLENQSAEERLEYFRSIFSNCTLCYACRDACPLCYCPTCFVDRPAPRWFGKKTTLADAFFFHLLRVMHHAGRCTDCGACEHACPMGIPVTKLSRKLNKDIRLLYSFEAGLNIETPLPLSVYDPDDPQDFILTEELKKKAKGF